LSKIEPVVEKLLCVCKFFFLCRTPITGHFNLSLQGHFLYQLWLAYLCIIQKPALQLQISHRDPKNSPISIAEANQQKGFMNIQYTINQPQGSD
jgi:hypothetical protein